MGAAPLSTSSDARSNLSLARHTSPEPRFDLIVGMSDFDVSAANITQDEFEALVTRGTPLELVVWSSKTRDKHRTLVAYFCLRQRVLYLFDH
ncbi:hypothetical protein AURDEDRAFT_165945 [Auricularia subglabra TFB-10046 SS5]|nr:hypothetical protein AURDEDRAFT_165945 [Auricularia subglabra TFB-10046 SS5]